MTEPVPSPHRLVLSGAEFEFLVRRTGLGLPPPFDGSTVSSGQSTADQTLAALDPSLVDDSRTDAAAELRTRGVLNRAGRVHPSVLANLAVLAAPRLLVRVEATLPGGRSRAVFAVADELGASLFARADGAVELSLFAAVTLGRELIRAVPVESDVDLSAGRIRSSLGDPAPLAGRVPVAVLAEYEAMRGLFDRTDGPGAGPGGTAAELALAADLVAGTRGGLHASVVGRDEAGVGAGQVVWLATDAGWVGLAPCSTSDGRTLVEARPAERADLGTWLAPFIAGILAATPGEEHGHGES